MESASLYVGMMTTAKGSFFIASLLIFVTAITSTTLAFIGLGRDLFPILSLVPVEFFFIFVFGLVMGFIAEGLVFRQTAHANMFISYYYRGSG